MRGDGTDQLLDLGRGVRGSATGALRVDGCAQLAQERIAAAIGLRLVDLCLAFLSCFLGLLRDLVCLRLDLVH